VASAMISLYGASASNTGNTRKSSLTWLKHSNNTYTRITLISRLLSADYGSGSKELHVIEFAVFAIESI
jgi:hypothetical protein